MLEDTKIDVKLKITALWIAMLFIFAYVDIFAFFRADFIEGILAGYIDGMQINQAFLMFTTVYILIPSLMVFLSLVLKSTINRLTNIIVGMLYVVSILFFSIGETWFFYIFASIIEVILLLLIVWFAWKWPKQKKSDS